MNKIFLKNKNSGEIFEFNHNFDLFDSLTIRLIPCYDLVNYVEIYCGRPSVLGNDFSWKEASLAKYKVKSLKESIDKFRKIQIPKLQKEIDKLKQLLTNNNICLTCWCVPKPCHCTEIAKKILCLI